MIGVQFESIHQGRPAAVSSTAMAATVFASFVTLLNSERHRHGRGPVGFLNPTLYELGTNQSLGLPTGGLAFRDITEGNNSCCSSLSPATSPVCCSTGFSAAPGW
jgi:tripeptidyl-peptidase-1